MTIEIEDDTVDLIEEEFLSKNQYLTEITFNQGKSGIEVRLHFRENLEDGTYSAPAYNAYTLKPE